MRYIALLVTAFFLYCVSSTQVIWVNSIRELAKTKKDIVDSNGKIIKVINHPNNVWELHYKEVKK